MNNIGEKIAQLRKDRSMTQEELASVIGVSAQSVSKWENNITMPDIMLLPVIAGIFEITIDELFHDRIENKVKPFSRKTGVEDIYMSHLENMQRAWAGSDPEGLTEAAMVSGAERTRLMLENHPKGQTGIVSTNGGAIYANKDIALMCLPSKQDSLSLLDNQDVGGMLQALSGDAFRRILKYQLENPQSSFTASSVSVKCGMEETEVEKALSDLVKYRFLLLQEVDLGGNELLKVYSLGEEYKMNLVLYPLLHLTERMANFQECWFGLLCD